MNMQRDVILKKCQLVITSVQQHLWVISKVLHTVFFLFKNEFILQKTFTGLQCNLHCALSQQSNVLANLVFLLLIGLITWVTSLDTFSMLLKRFPRSSFFSFGNKSNSGGLMSGLYGGWGSTCHPYFFKISDTVPEAWGRVLSCKMRTLAANIAHIFGESLEAKLLAEIWCTCDRASYMKMTRGTNLMQQLLFIIINNSTCFGHLYVHLQECRLSTAACGVQHWVLRLWS